ncbi:MAG: hypothetical protein RIR26_2967 [Pseudomonadota bacterium]|jgi:hypothetical protein
MSVLAEITSFTERYHSELILRNIDTVLCNDGSFEIPCLELKPSHPKIKEKDRFTLLLVAGVHGLEKIGVTVLLHYLEHVIETARWNSAVRSMLSSARIVALPALNPSGIHAGRRANANGVDLMRNAPVRAESPVPFLGGQTISPLLPYYRGGGEIEVESRALINVVQNLLETSTGLIALDLHSGFGARDRVWTPWAMSSALPPHWEHYLTLEKALNESFPDHVYKFERQSQSYQTDGDIWDYLLIENQSRNGPLFMPLALEMGSWNWLKKAPWRAFSKIGWFHPVAPHRVQRVCRRHLTLLDFLLNVCANGTEFFKN